MEVEETKLYSRLAEEQDMWFPFPSRQMRFGHVFELG